MEILKVVSQILEFFFSFFLLFLKDLDFPHVPGFDITQVIWAVFYVTKLHCAQLNFEKSKKQKKLYSTIFEFYYS